MATEKTDKQRADELEATVATLKNRIVTLEADLAAGAQAAESERIQAEKARADAAEAKVAQFGETLTQAVRQRAKLEREASAIMGPAFRMDDLTERQIHESVVKRLDASVNVSAENDDQVRGRYNTLLDLSARNLESQQRVAEILGRNKNEARSDAAADREGRLDAHRNQWRQTVTARNAQKGA